MFSTYLDSRAEPIHRHRSAMNAMKRDRLDTSIVVQTDGVDTFR